MVFKAERASGVGTRGKQAGRSCRRWETARPGHTELCEFCVRVRPGLGGSHEVLLTRESSKLAIPSPVQRLCGYQGLVLLLSF